VWRAASHALTVHPRQPTGPGAPPKDSNVRYEAAVRGGKFLVVAHGTAPRGRAGDCAQGAGCFPYEHEPRAVVDCRTLLDALTSGHRRGAARDVYEA